jgi:putative transposase
MSRVVREIKNDTIYHVFNRSAGKRRLFDSDDDYRRFGRILTETQMRVSMRLVGYCVMPTHFHLVVWPFEGRSLSDFMQRLTTRHALEHNRSRGVPGAGHVYQGRFGSVAVEGEKHLLTVLRYVEANPRVAGLVAEAQQWRWSSAAIEPDGPRPTVDLSPLPRPGSWLHILNND